MHRVLSPTIELAIVVALAAAPMISLDPALAAGAATVHRATIDSVPVLTQGRSVDAAVGVSAPMTDTARQNRMIWSIDQGGASYALVRSQLDRRLLPTPEVIRLAELANAFGTAHSSPPAYTVGLAAEIFPSPTRPGYHVLALALQGAARLRHGTVFVAVVEGSATAIPRIREALRLFAGALDDHDRLGIVAYGSRGRMRLEPTRVGSRTVIDQAVDALRGSGTPDLVSGLQMGYEIAARAASAGAASGEPGKIVLFSDGPGATSPGKPLFDDLRRQARAGLTLSVVGFPGEGYDDRLMARLASSGDGRYAIADNSVAARRLFSWLPDSLNDVARDVTGHIELDPEAVSRFRLLGEPLRGDAMGDVGGHSLSAGGRATALIELQLTGKPGPLGTVRVRYRPISGDGVKHLEMKLPSPSGGSSNGLRSWIAATFGEKLSGSFWARDVSYSKLLRSFRLLDTDLRIDSRTAELRYLIQQAQRLEQDRARSHHEDVEMGPPDPRDRAGNRVSLQRPNEMFDQLRVLE